ncbi:MAG: alpha/beta hydrolase-fold protein, partial [Acidobacteriota bacterium]|nr:alpha/beta hydrolase-fold protein [Acidobacteriota bacterium]
GKSLLYGEMLTREIKPMIDREFRTRKGPGNTGLGGSSLGGLVSLEIGLRYSQVFGKLAIMSPSLWWDDEVMLRRVQALDGRLPLRIWLDMGLEEGERCVADTRHMRDALEAKGWVEGIDLQHREYPGAGHTEAAWRARMGQVLQFLFPAVSV